MRVSTKMKWLSIGLFILVLAGCSPAITKPQKQVQPAQLSLWAAEWQAEASLQDAKSLGSHLQSVELFAIYFTEDGQLQRTAAFNKMYERAKQEFAVPLTISLVNDRIFKSGQSIQKDPQLVTDFVKDDASRKQHKQAILQLVEQTGAKQIELDYERVRLQDWQNYNVLIDDLYKALHERQVTLRIVIEPGVPFEKITFPVGPTYVVMAYNLYGTHSGPGPKANFALLKETANQLLTLPKPHSLAIATGGFWWSDGKVVPVTEKEAQQLVQDYQVKVTRDKNSSALTGTFKNEKGQVITLWYADGTTLTDWIAYTKRSGIQHISIWRAGGLTTETIEMLRQETKK